MTNEIESNKIFIRDLFGWWFRVPDYQRPYVWDTDQVVDLLEDIADWRISRPESEYFIGSIVLQGRQTNGIVEYDLLDGQQRLTTCLMAHAVARDLTQDSDLKDCCRKTVYQKKMKFDNIPERLRIVYDIRDEVREFVDRFIKPEGGTNDEIGLKAELSAKDLSVRNMANAVIEMRRYFSQAEAPNLEDFFVFFRNQVLLVYVASPNLDDAFQMFTVLNDRGMKLRGSDILKTLNLRALRAEGGMEDEQHRWARFWEETEGEVGEDFDVFLSHLRAVLVKDKARLSLLQEFEDNIYEPRVFDKQRKVYEKATPLLKPGRDTFRFVERYYSHYQVIRSDNNYHLGNSWRFDNLITLLDQTSQADFWVPPLLRYREVFGDRRIIDFLHRLENKFCGDWITGQMPNDRVMAMNRLTAAIDEVNNQSSLSLDQKIEGLFSTSVFGYDRARFLRTLDSDIVYGRRFARYLLFKLDVLYASPDTRLQAPKDMSVEHILPQNPAADSQWCRDFSDAEREDWTDRLGNLVLLGRRKNSSQGRLDFKQKRKKYFKNNVETFPNSVRAIQVEHWDLPTLKAHHNEVLEKLRAHC